jgi:hypothetical protein
MIWTKNGNIAILSEPPIDEIALARPRILMNHIDMRVALTSPKDPCPIVLIPANPINNFHSESTVLIHMVTNPIKTTNVARVRLAPNLSIDLPITIMNAAALREAAEYMDENVDLDHPISSIIGCRNMDMTYV